ncbi:TetR/AcrR family transcriptional regulator [Lysobacter yananisis]|uniref:TetR/AcrR family transcriptional regulator n=1 Tax=Lysobacter yananisis TaxID=1003114 RepID=A0ABY9P509_9GAMM|nr:TetR/AcrR family transcriptional regulator [Lysobacter yananisis]WMT02153.1 TetR/AcrR family transcriptional regulator [Lysobacter yananisis]
MKPTASKRTASDPQTSPSPKAEEILQRTSELLALGGYDSFSYADIAEQVQVRKASIHHHFPNKVDLVKATVARHRESSRRGMQALSERVADPFERLGEYCRWWAACIESANPPICLCALLAAELPSVPAEVASEVRGHFEDLSAWLEQTLAQGADGGRVRLAASAHAEAMTFMAAVHGAMLTARALGDARLFWSIAQASLERLRPA